MKQHTKLAFLAATSFAAAHQLPGGVGNLPAMGWNTWNTYATSIDATLILESAQALIDSGLSKMGYEYVNLDDSWQAASRMANGTLMYNEETFPDGLKDLTDKIHAMGFKAGIYSSAGRYTCGNYPASLGFETQDANSYAEWGFDYLKYDNCFNEGQSGTANISYARYEVMSNALNATGRPILYSLCNWGQDGTWDWASTIANSYRISGDVYPSFDRADDRCPCETYDCPGVQGYHCSIANIVEKAAPIGQKVRAGSFGDMDMLEVGHKEAMTFAEQVAHMSMWSINKSPLILGNDVRNMSDETVAILSNKAIIAINQDSGTTPATRVYKKPVAAMPDPSVPSWGVQPTTAGNLQLWSGSLKDGDKYLVTLFNTSPQNLTLSVPLIDAFSAFDYGDVSTKAYTAFDVWAPAAAGSTKLPANATRAEIASVAYGADLPDTVCGSLPEITVEAHGVRVFLLTETNASCPAEATASRKMMMGRSAWM